MRHQRRIALAGGAALSAALLALACDPPSPMADQALPSPDFHIGCISSGVRFTGGGRVDEPDIGKVTFGFNVDGRDACASSGAIKGHVQVVEHTAQVLIHSDSITRFSSFTNSTGGQCGEWDGIARIKEVKGASNDWFDRHFFMQVCDNGEPGHGVDTIEVFIDGAGSDGQLNNVLEITLTGGNIQAHKS